jgi:hypothetical protein
MYYDIFSDRAQESKKKAELIEFQNNVLLRKMFCDFRVQSSTGAYTEISKNFQLVFWSRTIWLLVTYNNMNKFFAHEKT